MSHPLASSWRQEADLLEARGLKDLAGMVRSYADELDKWTEDWGNELLTLDEAACESGYSKDHLSLMISQGKLPNAGKKGAPRIRRRDLPKKPRSQPVSRTSNGGPNLVAASLSDQGIPSAES